MFGLTEWKQTRFYQEVKGEGQIEGREEQKEEMLSTAVPQLLGMGLSLEQIARALDVDVETVRKFSSRS